ncbi:MAG: hypothetical protein IE926_03355 [Micrococcales bacterium]|nr:hypothetical protein [Micrococcales bacterium]
MTHDLFEDELRTMLRGAAEAQRDAFVEVDTAEVLGTGQRVLRRRRRALVGGTLAATLVVGVGGWAVLDRSGDRAAVEVPATRSATPTSPVTAVLDEFADLSGTGGTPLSIPGPRQVAVRVVPGATPDLQYLEVGAGGRTTLLGGSSLDGVPRTSATWGTAGEGGHVLIGVAPAEARDITVLTPISDEGGHASTLVTKELPGTGRQAFAVRFAEAGDADAVRHLLWRDAEDAVRDENGAAVASVALGDGKGTIFWVSDALGRFGTFGGDGPTWTALDGARNSSGRPVLSMGRGDGAVLTGLFVAVVPAAAEPGSMTPRAGSTVTHPLTKVLLPGTEYAALWATWTQTTADSLSGYTEVTWTEDGRTVTQRP